METKFDNILKATYQYSNSNDESFVNDSVSYSVLLASWFIFKFSVVQVFIMKDK